MLGAPEWKPRRTLLRVVHDLFLYISRTLVLLRAQHLLNNLNNMSVHRLGRSNNALILLQRPPNAKVERLAIGIRHLAASLLHEHDARGVVPDLLLVCLAGGQTEIQIACAAGDGAVLGLRVHADRVLCDAELGGDGSLVAVRAVTGLDGLAEGGLRDVGERGHCDFLGLCELAVGQSAACGALALDCAEQDAIALRGSIEAGLAVERCLVVDGQVGTPDYANGRHTVDHQRQTHGVLAATKEALCAVDGVKRPDTPLVPALTGAAVECCEHVVCALNGPTDGVFGGRVAELRLLNKVPYKALQVGIGAQVICVLLAHNLVVWECRLDTRNDQGLGAEVADCDGRAVSLCEGAFAVRRVDALCEDGGALDGQQGELELLLVGHGVEGAIGVEEGGGGGGVDDGEVLLDVEDAGSGAVEGGRLEDCGSQDDGSEEKVPVWRNGGHQCGLPIHLLCVACRLVGAGRRWAALVGAGGGMSAMARSVLYYFVACTKQSSGQCAVRTSGACAWVLSAALLLWKP
jgi:hypothetical protein